LVRDDPWKVLVVVFFLNQTSGKQVRRVFPVFFERWPTPQAFLLANEDEVKEVIRSLGFKNRRYERLVRMTVGYLTPGWTDVRSLHGVGKYAADSYRMFVEGVIPDDVEDKELRRFREWSLSLPIAGGTAHHERPDREGPDPHHHGAGGVQRRGGESASAPA
jgi:hypothetical protein